MKKSTQSLLMTLAIGVAAYYGWKKFKAHQVASATAIAAANPAGALAVPTGADAASGAAPGGVIHGLRGVGGR